MRGLLAAIVYVALAGFCWGQQGVTVNQVGGPPPNATVIQNGYNGSNQLIWSCQAQAYQPTTSYYVATTTLTSIAVTANVGTITFSTTTGLWTGAWITVIGSTTSALNGAYKVTGTSGSTATIATSGVANGTYNNAALSVSTNAPLLNAAVWSIQELVYSGSNLVGTYFAMASAPGVGAAVPSNLACSNATNF